MRKWWVELFTIEQCRVAHKQINRTLRQQHNMMMYSHEWCLADLWEEGQPKRLRCRTMRTSPNKKKTKQNKNNTIKTHEIRCTYANVFATWIDLCFSCKSWRISRGDYSRAGTDVHMDFRLVRLPACLHASGNYAKKEHQKAPPPPPKPTSKQGTSLHVRE